MLTDENGQAAQALPCGRQTISVYANGYKVRTVSIKIVPGEQTIPNLGISARDLVESKVTTKEMTYEEIVEAGIDTTDPSNQHVYKYEIDIRFAAEFDWASFMAYFNTNGDYIGCKFGDFKTPDDDDDDDDDNGGSGTSGSSGGIRWEIGGGVGSGYGNGFGRWISFDFGGGETVTVYPVDEYFYLIIYGEARWLKEMYDVEMLVINHSLTDTLEDCSATLDLPKGLSLAAMCGTPQSLTQQIGTIAEGESTSVHWYVRGDEAGSYTVTARLQATMMPFEETIDREYQSENPIYVYAGNALHMNIYLPKYTYYGDDYSVRIELVNVSGKTLYNVSNAITGIKEGQVTYYSNGKVEDQVLLTEGVQDYDFAHVFNPGDKLVVETSVKILFTSKVAEYKKGQIIDTIDKAESMIGYYNNFTKAVNTMNKTIKTVSSALDGFISSTNDIAAAKVTATKKMVDAMLSFADGFSIGNKKAITVLEILNSGMYMPMLLECADDPSAIGDVSIEDIQDITKIFDIAKAEPEPFNIYDSLRTFVEALPVHFYVTDVFTTTLAGSTTTIPYSVIMDNNQTIQYFGIDDMGKYMYSLAIGMCGEIDVPWYLNLLGVEDDPIGYNDAARYIHMQEEQMKTIMVTDTTDIKECKVWAEPSQSTYSVSRNDASDAFVFSCDNETAVYEDGVLTFTGSGILQIQATGISDGTIYISSDGEIVQTYVVELTEKHTCSSENWVTEIHPTEEHDGFVAKYCDICGELIDTMVVEVCEDHHYGESKTETEENGMVVRYAECQDCGYRSYSVEDTEETEWLLGDVDGDGVVDAADSKLLSQYFAGWDVSDTITNLAGADVDGDGKLTRKDAMILARHVAGWTGYALPYEG